MSETLTEVSAGNLSEQNQVRNTIFISYSHRDAENGNEWYPDVLEYLAQLGDAEQNDVDVWTDKKIDIGDRWHEEINSQLEAARVAILLISPAFLESEFISEHEVPVILERHASQGLIVHPLICKPVPIVADDDRPLVKFLHEYQLATPVTEPLSQLSRAAREKILNDLVIRIKEELGPLQRYQRPRRQQFMENVRQIVRSRGITLSREVASGDTSIVYHAESAFHEVAVKAMISIPISETGEQEIKDEWLKSRRLKHSCFIRIHDVTVEKWFCAVVADYIRGYRLKYNYQWLKLYGERQNRRWTDVTAELLLDLAEAAAEAHAAKLRYLRFDPAKILIEHGRPRLYPVDFSSWLISIGHQTGLLRIPLDSLIYHAPELFENNGVDVRELEHPYHAIEKADQYALGVLALTLLQEGPPLHIQCLGDLPKLHLFHQDPRGFPVSDSEQQRLENLPWRRTAPALARVIWRMLERDPDKRWENIQEVVQQLRAVIGSATSISTHVAQAKHYYVSTIAGNDDFYQRFYQRFFELSPDSHERFAGIDWERQRRLLDDGIERLLNYRAIQNEPTTLTRIAQSHSNMGIDEDEFEHFGQAFIDTLQEAPDFDIDTQFAWEAVLWPGIEYIKTMSKNLQQRAPTAKPKKRTRKAGKK